MRWYSPTKGTVLVQGLHIVHKPFMVRGLGAHRPPSMCLSFLHCLGAEEPFLPAQPTPSWHLLTSTLLQVFAAEKEDHNLPSVTEGGVLPIFCFSHTPTPVEALPSYEKGFETKDTAADDGNQLWAAVSSVYACCDSTRILEYNSPPLESLPLHCRQLSDPWDFTWGERRWSLPMQAQVVLSWLAPFTVIKMLAMRQELPSSCQGCCFDFSSLLVCLTPWFCYAHGAENKQK